MANNWKILLKTLKGFVRGNSFQNSAAIAFYTIFSLPGIAIISVVTASSFFYDDKEVQKEILKQVTLLIGENSADQVEQVMNSTFLSYESLMMKIIGAIVLLISTTTVFVSLQESLNSIWEVKSKPKKIIIKMIINRLLSLAMVAAIGFLVLVSLTMDTLLAMLKSVLAMKLSDHSFYIIIAINFTFSILISLLVFASIYKVLPDVNIQWKDVWAGAIFTTILFTAGKYLIAYYLTDNRLTDAYGAAGSLVALLAWVYYSILILLFGAQFTCVYSRRKGRRIKPSRGAVSIEIVEVKKDKTE